MASSAPPASDSLGELSLSDLINLYWDRDASKLADIITFDGPPTAYIAGVPYVTITQFGVKAEGEAPCADEDRCWTKAEAVFKFKRALFEYLLAAGDVGQLAWRRRPEVHQTEDAGDWLATCRLRLLDSRGLPAKVSA